MSEKTHFEAFVDHITSDDISEISNIRAERDYALHCLEREIAICAQTQTRNEALVKALETAIRVADEAREMWDKAPDGMKAGKLLIALSDPSLHYRADISEMHTALASVKERA